MNFPLSSLLSRRRIIATLLALTVPALAPRLGAEEWVPYTNSTLELPGTGRLKGFSEAYYDRDSLLRTGSGKIQLRLKEFTYLGDLVPTIHHELLTIDCTSNGFELRVMQPGTANEEVVVNVGTIGSASPYRSIREAFCGY